MSTRTTITTALRRGDTVHVLTGIDRGKKGKVLQVLTDDGRIVVEGVAQRKKNVRAKQANQKGDVVTYNAPIALSNVQLVCPKCHKPTRIGHVRHGDDRKQRQCKKCHQVID